MNKTRNANVFKEGTKLHRQYVRGTVSSTKTIKEEEEEKKRKENETGHRCKSGGGLKTSNICTKKRKSKGWFLMDGGRERESEGECVCVCVYSN